MGLKKTITTTLDFILPPRCAVSGDIVDSIGVLTPSSWNNICFIDKPYCSCCGLPFDFTTDEEMLCIGCLDNPPNFDKSRSALVYGDGARPLILSFKHGDKIQLTHNFSKWMIRAGSDILSDTDIITPVPLHKKRLWKRRYNQSAVLAKTIAKNFQRIEYSAGLLARKRETPPQKGLTKAERLKNISGAIHKRHTEKQDITGKNICIVDDVYTSGATLNECAKILKKSGARNVYSLSLARVLL